jgi:hypothetical protein
MLSKVIKDMLEEKFGATIRYPKDCEALAAQISDACKQQISASTIKRLYGFVKGIEQPRLYTLDVISSYLGYSSWENLLMSLNKQNRPSREIIEHLVPSQLKKNSVIEIGYEPYRMITLNYIGKNIFEVVHSTDSKLHLGDVITFQSIDLHYPLQINEIKRSEKNVGQYLAGSVSGVTFIKKIQTLPSKS